VIDLDGVVWLTGEPLPGAPSAIAALREAGARVVFATNNASPTIEELVVRLHRAGIDAEASDLVTSAQAVATMVQPGERVMVIGEGGLLEALAAAPVEVVMAPPVSTVVVARTPRFDYRALALASEGVRDGARLLGTSEDATHPTPQGLVPGSGALLAAVSVASARSPEVAGKPHEPMCALLRRRAPSLAVVVGDRPSTDGVLAERLGARFALVRSGATKAEPDIGVSPDATAPDLRSVVESALRAVP
jgi:HAD superfamily hydrolase (TIGR01450 family)